MSRCNIRDCKKETHAKGLCGTHYRRLQRHSDPNFINPKHIVDGKAKERAYAQTKRWKKANKEYYHAYIAARRAHLKRATPPWADLKAIENFYRNRPPGYHVDHIIPLNGRDISGLHIIENLQYLPAIENLRKSNKTVE